MSEGIVIALIGAGSAVLVGGFGLLRQLIAERRADRAARIEAQQAVNEELLSEYRHLLAEVRTALADERADHTQTSTERDEARRRCRRCEQTLDDLRLRKEME